MSTGSLFGAAAASPHPLARPLPLRLHAFAAATAATAATLGNLLLAPDRLWAPWLALALGAGLAAHGATVLAAELHRPAPAPPADDPAAGATAPETWAPPVASSPPDPGPPLFPDSPAAPRRRWIPRSPDGPAPGPRVAAFSEPGIRPLPSPRAAASGEAVGVAVAVGMDMDGGTNIDALARLATAWPPAPRPATDRAVRDDWAAARAALPTAARAGQESAAGW